MSLDLPEGWSLKRLGDVCEIGGGVGFKEAMQGRRDLPFPFIKVSDMNDPGNEIEIRSARNYVDAEMLKAMGAKLFPVGSVVLPKVGAAALTNKRRQLANPTAVDNNLMVWTPSSIDPSFLLHWSRTIDVASLVQTGALPSLNKTIAENIPLILPPLHEQRQIAEILSSVDDAIAATRAVIEQTRKVKQGVLERLLTKGVGHTRFKQTEIGEIPEGWDIVRLNHIASRTTYGFTNPMSTVDDGPWMITAANIKDGRIDYSSARKTDRTEFETLLSEKSKPAKNTILITKDGTLGRVALVDEGDLCINQSVAAVTPSENMVRPRFLYWLLQSPSVQDRILAEAGGSTIKHIYISKLAETILQLPPMGEQDQIIDYIDAVQLTSDSQLEELDALVNTKSVLMSDLLTGRKRVTEALPMAAE